jgi:hypothetical protein
VGLHKGRRPDEQCDLATVTHCVLLPLRNTFGRQTWLKNLSGGEMDEPEEHGLVATSSANVFIGPGSADATPLWFCRTSHAWYWTPQEPASFDVEDLKLCKWSVIWQNEPVEAIGALWDGGAPVLRNQEVIAWIISTGLRFLQYSRRALNSQRSFESRRRVGEREESHRTNEGALPAPALCAWRVQDAVYCSGRFHRNSCPRPHFLYS